VRLSAGEGETWLEAAGRAARCGRGERLPRVALALLLLWPGLGKLVPRRSLLQTLQALQARADALLLLVAAQFHAGQSGAVLDLARQLLLGHVVQGAGGSRGAGAAGELGTLFTEELYPEAQLARQALQLRAEEAAGLQCQYLLLRSRLLSRHRVELHDWILEFLRHARRPMHPLAPALIIEYARCCCALPAAPSLPAPADFAMRAPSEAELRSLLAPAATAAAAAAASGELELGQALAILLALQLDELAQQPGARGKVGFRREFLADLPLRQAVQFARQHEPLLYPSLLSLSIAVCPQRFMPGPLLLAEAARGEALEEALEEDEPEATQRAGTSADELEALLEQEAVALTEASTRDRALAVLARVCRDPQAEWAGGRLARPLQALARRLLELPAGGAGVRALQDAFRRAAEALQAVASWELARLCADAFRDTSLQVPPRAPDLAEDPLALLRCDSRLFRCPPLLAVLLQALNAALTASRRLIHARLQQQQQPPSSAPPSAALQLQPQASAQTAARAEEHSTLVLAQDSAALQLLLEACLPREGEEDGEGCLEEVRALVCGFAHELFIENPLLIKLLHFQTYDVRLLPCTTRRIGSMHVCLDFLPELLAQPQSERQAFALHLAAHLCELYPLPKSMQLARHILQLLRPATVAGQQQQQQQRPTPIPPLPLEAALAALPRICRAFPFLLAECSEVLNELRPSSALAASTTSFSILDARIQHAFMLSARATLQSSVS
jgi:integrator complex subunit 2